MKHDAPKLVVLLNGTRYYVPLVVLHKGGHLPNPQPPAVRRAHPETVTRRTALELAAAADRARLAKPIPAKKALRLLKALTDEVAAKKAARGPKPTPCPVAGCDKRFPRGFGLNPHLVAKHGYRVVP